ncbi:unnamed protein product [Boreogadus saida]
MDKTAVAVPSCLSEPPMRRNRKLNGRLVRGGHISGTPLIKSGAGWNGRQREDLSVFQNNLRCKASHPVPSPAHLLPYAGPAFKPSSRNALHRFVEFVDHGAKEGGMSEEPNLTDPQGLEVGAHPDGRRAEPPRPAPRRGAANEEPCQTQTHKQSLPQTTAQEPRVAAVAVVSAAGGDGELRRSVAPVVLIVGECAVRLALARGKAPSVHVNNNINNNNN